MISEPYCLSFSRDGNNSILYLVYDWSSIVHLGYHPYLSPNATSSTMIGMRYHCGCYNHVPAASSRIVMNVSQLLVFLAKITIIACGAAFVCPI